MSVDQDALTQRAAGMSWLVSVWSPAPKFAPCKKKSNWFVAAVFAGPTTDTIGASYVKVNMLVPSILLMVTLLLCCWPEPGARPKHLHELSETQMVEIQCDEPRRIETVVSCRPKLWPDNVKNVPKNNLVTVRPLIGRVWLRIAESKVNELKDVEVRPRSLMLSAVEVMPLGWDKQWRVVIDVHDDVTHTAVLIIPSAE